MSVFTAGQKHQLKNVLGEHYAALLPLLEEADRPVDGPRAPSEYKTEEKAQKKVAVQLTRASQRFMHALETAQARYDTIMQGGDTCSARTEVSWSP